MSAVPSSLACRNTPKPAGGWASRSTSSLRATIWSRASRRVLAKPLVLRGHACQVGLQLDDPLFENPRVTRRVGELTSQDGDLLLKKGDLARGVLRTPCGPVAAVDVVVVGCHGPHLLQGELDASRPYLGRCGLKPLDHKDGRGVSDLHPCARPSRQGDTHATTSESGRLYRRVWSTPVRNWYSRALGGHHRRPPPCRRHRTERRTGEVSVSDAAAEALEVWIDQDLCTGDGICVQYAPEVFELDIDGLAYVKGDDDELLAGPGRHRPGAPAAAAATWWIRPRSAPATASTYAGCPTGSRSTDPTRALTGAARARRPVRRCPRADRGPPGTGRPASSS